MLSVAWVRRAGLAGVCAARTKLDLAPYLFTDYRLRQIPNLHSNPHPNPNPNLDPNMNPSLYDPDYEAYSDSDWRKDVAYSR